MRFNGPDVPMFAQIIVEGPTEQSTKRLHHERVRVTHSKCYWMTTAAPAPQDTTVGLMLDRAVQTLSLASWCSPFRSMRCWCGGRGGRQGRGEDCQEKGEDHRGCDGITFFIVAGFFVIRWVGEATIELQKRGELHAEP